MRVGTNVSALTANNSLKKTDTALSKAMERLSTGLKVNHAKDNPAGIAIAKRMRSQINGLSIAGDNANDGISVMETADGALSEIHSILQRMSELAVEASSGTKTDSDREAIDAEIKQLKQEIDRIADSTDFNGQTLLDGTFDLRGYTSEQNVKVSYYSDEVPIQKYEIDLDAGVDADGNVIINSISAGTGFPSPVSYSIDGDIATITSTGGFEIKFQATAAGTYSNVSVDITGIGAMRMQIGANEGQNLAMRIPTVSLKTLGISSTSVATESEATDAIGRFGEAIEYISNIRARLGAYQNRLETSSESLDLTEEKMTSSYSRIMDVDMAEEMTEYTTQQVLMQAGTSILAQANERPQQVLQLLQ